MGGRWRSSPSTLCRARDTLADSGIQQAISQFLDRVRTREVPHTSGEDAFLTHELVDRIYRACGLPPLA